LVQAAERKLADEVPPAQAIQAAVAGLFEAPRGAEIDVVALACTHFPLLSAELAALAPRPCLWLDSGSAIARRLADVLSARAGTARARRAAFSDAAGALAMQRAFRARGFDDLYNASADAAFAPV
jgi:glutamate racemase